MGPPPPKEILHGQIGRTGKRSSAPGAVEGAPQSRKHETEAVKLRMMYGVEGTAKPHLGEAHPCHLDQLHETGYVMQCQNRPNDAVEVLRLAWEGRRAKLGEDHPLTHNSLRDLAEALRQRGESSTAQDLLWDNRCHGFFTRHPTSGNGLLATTAVETHVRPKVPRSAKGCPLPTPEPCPRDTSEHFLRRSHSMGAALRRTSRSVSEVRATGWRIATEV